MDSIAVVRLTNQGRSRSAGFGSNAPRVRAAEKDSTETQMVAGKNKFNFLI